MNGFILLLVDLKNSSSPGHQKPNPWEDLELLSFKDLQKFHLEFTYFEDFKQIKNENCL